MAPDSAPTQPLFPRLSGGPGGRGAEGVGRHQKARLQGAMVEAVARHGYAGVTLRELVGLAGVSKSTFYDHFESKQDCFLSTFDEIMAQAQERVAAAHAAPGGREAKLGAAVRAFMELAAEEPAAAALATVEVLTLGAAGVASQERAAAGFESLVQQDLDPPADGPISEHIGGKSAHRQRNGDAPVLARAVVAGIRGVAYRRLRAGAAAELPGLAPTIAAWALSYAGPDSEAVTRAAAAAGVQRVLEQPRAADGPPGWDEPPDSPRSRRALSQRERIVRAAARLAVARGYEALSIPAISGAAGTSNQTFYEHFTGKRDPFLAAFEELAATALEIAAAASAAEGDGPEAVGAGLRALLDHVAADELFARFAFFELPAAGPAALDRADETIDALLAQLRPGAAPGGAGDPLPTPALEAIAGGIWAVIQHEIAGGRRLSLPQLAPELARFALAPSGVTAA